MKVNVPGILESLNVELAYVGSDHTYIILFLNNEPVVCIEADGNGFYDIPEKVKAEMKDYFKIHYVNKGGETLQ